MGDELYNQLCNRFSDTESRLVLERVTRAHRMSLRKPGSVLYELLLRA